MMHAIIPLLDADFNDSTSRYKSDLKLEMIQEKYPAHEIILLKPVKDKINSWVQ